MFACRSRILNPGPRVTIYPFTEKSQTFHIISQRLHTLKYSLRAALANNKTNITEDPRNQGLSFYQCTYLATYNIVAKETLDLNREFSFP